MPTVSEIVFAVALCTVLAAGALIALALVRRKQREKHFRELDELRRLSFPIISSLAAGTLDHQHALQALGEIFPSGPDRAQAVEGVLFDGKSPLTIPVPVLRQLVVDFGLVALWEGIVLGRSEPPSWRQALSQPARALEGIQPLRFLPRARSAERLGLACHAPSWRVLVRALDDPHPEVRSAAARALGAIAEPGSFPALVECLQSTVLMPSPGLSIRHIKAALVRFPLSQARELAESLKHSHPRVRFLAADVVREMVERSRSARGTEEEPALKGEDFAPELADLFLTRLVFDENPDVRARTAPVIARLDDPRATLRLVTLLNDAQWFVRLHAVRALARRRLVTLAEHITRRLTDANWRVREAAVRALLSFGPAGVERLLEHFLTTEDRYSLEQIAEGLQRAGPLPVLLGEYGHDGAGRKTEVIQRLIGLGQSSYLPTALESGADDRLRERLLKNSR